MHVLHLAMARGQYLRSLLTTSSTSGSACCAKAHPHRQAPAQGQPGCSDHLQPAAQPNAAACKLCHRGNRCSMPKTRPVCNGTMLSTAVLRSGRQGPPHPCAIQDFCGRVRPFWLAGTGFCTTSAVSCKLCAGCRTTSCILTSSSRTASARRLCPK